jgi:hypothetical protein
MISSSRDGGVVCSYYYSAISNSNHNSISCTKGFDCRLPERGHAETTCSSTHIQET